MNPRQLEGAIWSTLRLQDMVYNDMLLPEAARGNDNTLWQTYKGGVAIINRTWAFTDIPKPIELIEAEMRFQWRLFVLAAKNIEAHHPAQDRLKWLILWTRETGVLSRVLEKSNGDAFTEQAFTTQGRIWTDLPFMLQDVQKAWREAMMSASDAGHSHCHNLTAAIARLAAVGVLHDAFSGCGFEIMMQALEISKSSSDAASAVVQGGSKHFDAEASGESGLTLSLLLPLIQFWLHYAGRKLLQLSVATYSNDQSGWRIYHEAPGKLSQNLGIDRINFSKATFQCWKTELAKLKEHDFEESTSKESAKACSGIINDVWDEFFWSKSLQDRGHTMTTGLHEGQELV